MRDISLRVLGTLELFVADQAVRLAGRRQKIVLATLCLANEKAVSVAKLVDAIWEQGRAPRTAEKQVRNTISDLRKICPELDDSIETTVTGYRLTIAPEALDSVVFVARFERAQRLRGASQPAEARREYRAALDLWGGSALGDIDSPALDADAVVLNELRLAATEEWLELELVEGPIEGSTIGMVSTLVEENPYRERLVGQLMKALCQVGGRSRALQVYERTCAVMLDEIGVAPGDALRELRDKLIHSDIGSAPERTPPLDSTLPADVPHFVGRADELQALVEFAETAALATRVVVIDGMAGVGKTALAVHVARRSMANYPDGALFVDMGTGSTPLDTATALEALLLGIGVARELIPESTHGRSAMWRSQVEQRSMVIVLDDAACTAQLRPLIAPGGRCLTIVTSRYRLYDLDVARPVSLEPFTAREGHDLFVRTVGDARPILDTDSVDDVVQRCGYLPLAIRIAATRIRHRPEWSICAFVQHLDADVCRIVELSAEERSVAGAFEASYRRLRTDQRQVMCALPRIGPIQPGVVADAIGVPVPVAERLLDELTDAHLVQQPSPGVYRAHVLLRAYATALSRKAHAPGAERTAVQSFAV